MKGVERVIAIQCEAMHCDFLGDPNTDCGNFPGRLWVGNPHATAPFYLFRLYRKFSTHPYQELFDPANMGNNVNGVSKSDNRVTHNLPWSVPGDFSASVHIDNRSTCYWAFGNLSTFSCGIDTCVFKKQDCVASLAGDDLRVNLFLVIPGLLVVNIYPEVFNFKHAVSPVRIFSPTRRPLFVAH
jgi:hypothetical protein